MPRTLRQLILKKLGSWEAKSSSKPKSPQIFSYGWQSPKTNRLTRVWVEVKGWYKRTAWPTPRAIKRGLQKRGSVFLYPLIWLVPMSLWMPFLMFSRLFIVKCLAFGIPLRRSTFTTGWWNSTLFLRWPALPSQLPLQYNVCIVEEGYLIWRNPALLQCQGHNLLTVYSWLSQICFQTSLVWSSSVMFRKVLYNW